MNKVNRADLTANYNYNYFNQLSNVFEGLEIASLFAIFKAEVAEIYDYLYIPSSNSQFIIVIMKKNFVELFLLTLSFLHAIMLA